MLSIISRREFLVRTLGARLGFDPSGFPPLRSPIRVPSSLR